MSLDRTITKLKIASGIVIGFGFLGVLGTLPALSAPIAFLLDLIFWPLDGTQGLQAPESRLLLAIASGGLVGWGVLLWLVTTQLYAKQPLLARKLILSSISTWFVLDSIGSIASGAPINVVFNFGFLVLFFVPLWQKAPSKNEPA